MKPMKTIRDLLESAKKRTILLCLWVVGLAYLMSLTSHSVWVNVPIALLIIAFIRSLSGEVQIRWKAGQIPRAKIVRGPRYRRRAAVNDSRSATDHSVYEIWRQGVEAPEVEAALEELTNAVVKEWVTDLWFRSLSSDPEFPDELANLINNVFAELSRRVRKINLITLLTRDIVDLLSFHLELFRKTQARVGADKIGISSAEERDENIKQALLANGDLHPALVSADSENLVLHKLVGGVIALVLKPDDGNCGVTKTLSRELLACAVMRPVMNLLNPAFINTLIENQAARNPTPVVDTTKGTTAGAKRNPDRPPLYREPSSDVGTETGATLQSKTAQEDPNGRGGVLKTSPSEASLMRLASGDMSVKGGKGEADGQVEGFKKGANKESKENWAQLLEVVNQRKTLALHPEHLDNLWTKGRNYKKLNNTKPGSKPAETSASREQPVPQTLVSEPSIPPPAKSKAEGIPKKSTDLVDTRATSAQKLPESGMLQSESSLSPDQLNTVKDQLQAVKMTGSETSSPVPPEPVMMRRSRSIGAELDGWQNFGQSEEGIPSLLKAGQGVGLGPGFDLDLALRKLKGDPKNLEPNESQALSNMLVNHLQVDVVGAHFEKGGSKTFAVYSIFVTDLQNRTWEVQRRFRNFEQLHRNLRDKPYYNLCLPAKRFLSSNLDNSFIRQRCTLLDKYLKDLLAIPSIAEAYEVWDFLSANSQTYAFSDSPSMFKTLTSNVDDAMDDVLRQFRAPADVKPASTVNLDELRKQMMGNSTNPTTAHLSILTDGANTERASAEKSALQRTSEEDAQSNQGGPPQSLGLGWLPGYDLQQSLGGTPFIPELGILDMQRDVRTFEGRLDQPYSEGNSPVGSLNGSELAEDDNLAIPPDWGPPKVSVPLLNLVDVIFELHGRGWIRRQVFWMAKQVLQLGMGDAIDDFLLGKIQELRREEVVASGIRWLQKILWPDGIFLTKHPTRLANNAKEGTFDQRLEAARRAGIVREIILERAPAALVSLIGRRQYQRCAKDLYFFLQSAVCLKQLTYSLLEQLLLTAFPELQDVIEEVRSM